MPIKLLGISGSLRRQSCNTGLLRAAQSHLPPGVTLEIADLSEVPFYNADLQAKPAAVARVLGQMAEADAFVFACPEYNYSLAPALKNILDWASREPGNNYYRTKRSRSWAPAAAWEPPGRSTICVRYAYSSTFIH